MALTGKFRNPYTNKSGNRMYVYSVTGTNKELEDYRQTQNNQGILREDNGVPLFFVSLRRSDGTFRDLRDSIPLTKTGGDNPRYIFDESITERNLIQESKKFLPQELARLEAEAMMKPTQRQNVSVTRVPVTTEGGPEEGPETGEGAPNDEETKLKELETGGTEDLG